MVRPFAILSGDSEYGEQNGMGAKRAKKGNVVFEG